MVIVAAGTALGMALRGSGAQAAGSQPPPPPNGQPSSSCTTPERSKAARLCSSQPFGDGFTVYVIHGSGFVPGTQVTVKLVGVGVSPLHPVADLEGDFNYAVDQGHYFFSGPMRPDTYTVVVTGAGGRQASTSFIVNQPQGGPPPGSPQGPPPT